MTLLLAAALAYAERGWPVIPVHHPVSNGCSCAQPDCDSVGKHPRIKGWVKDATTAPAKIREWWGKSPDANIGIATGASSQIILLGLRRFEWVLRRGTMQERLV
jgi:hypothetical protein